MKKIYTIILLLFIVACQTTGTKVVMQKDPYDSIDTEKLLDNQRNNKLMVAILVPLSGKAEKIGNMMLKSAQLAMFNHKLGNITLMPYDTKGTAFGAVDAINAAIRDGADIIIGPLFTAETKAIIEIAELNHLILLSFSDNQTLLDSRYSNLYLMGMTPKQEIDRIISYLIDYKDFYGFSAMMPNDVYGSNVSKMFKDIIFRKDAKIIRSEFYSKNDANLEKKVNSLLSSNTYREEVYKKYEEDKALAKAEGLNVEVEFKFTEEDKIYADALLLPDSGDELLKIGEYVASYKGTRKPILIGTSKWLNSPLYNNINFDDTMFVSPNPNNYTDFENLYNEAFGTYPLRVGSLAYDAVIAVIESYAKARGKEDLKYALENYQGFEGVNGKFRFISDGTVERKLAIIKIINGRFEIIDYDDKPFLKY